MGELRKGSFVLIKEHPCKIMETTTCKTGKHGHSKTNVTGIDIFTGKKYELCKPTTQNVDCPSVSKAEFTLIDIDENDFVSLMDDQTQDFKEIKLPDGKDSKVLCQKMRDALENDKEAVVC